MRRIVVVAVLMLAVAAPAEAWVESAAYAVPGDGTADCLRSVGSGRVVLSGALELAPPPIAAPPPGAPEE